MELLTEAQCDRLLGAQPGTFVPLHYHGERLTTVGLLSHGEGDLDSLSRYPLEIARDRVPPDFHPRMMKLYPLCAGPNCVGWLADLPALQIEAGRNYVKVARPRARLLPEQQPEVSVLLKQIIVMEIGDTMALLLSTTVHDMRT